MRKFVSLDFVYIVVDEAVMNYKNEQITLIVLRFVDIAHVKDSTTLSHKKELCVIL